MKSIPPPLRPGDAFLSLGTTPLSKAIVRTLGGRYSHASVFSGDSVIESTLPRAHEIAADEFVTKSALIHAYRHRHAEGFGDEIVSHARRYVGRPYSTADLLLGALIGTVTAWTRQRSDWLALNTSYSLGTARTLLEHLLWLYRERSGEHEGGERVTCVELVARAHLEAGLELTVHLEPSGVVDPEVLWPAFKDIYQRSRSPAPLQAELSVNQQLAQLERDLQWAAQVSQEIRGNLRSPDGRALVVDLQASVAQLRALELRVTDRGDAQGDVWYAGLLTPEQLAKSPQMCELGAPEPADLGATATMAAPPISSAGVS